MLKTNHKKFQKHHSKVHKNQYSRPSKGGDRKVTVCETQGMGTHAQLQGAYRQPFIMKQERMEINQFSIQSADKL